MDRREAIRNVAFLMGGALSATTMGVVLSGFTSVDSIPGFTFSWDQEALITEIADIILPTTKESPGAQVAGVGPFIPMMIRECYPGNVQKAFAEGLEDIERKAKSLHQKSFLAISRKEREEIIAQVREETIAGMADDRKMAAAARVEAERLKNMSQAERAKNPKATIETPKNKSYFFPVMRDLTMLGFFSSEVGCTQAYRFVEIPGRYDGCVDLQPGQKLWK